MKIPQGTIIGFWTVVGPETKHRANPRGFKYYVLCRCVCGKLKSVSVNNLKYGQTKSCGCQRKNRLTHGMSSTPEYGSWLRMKQRCYDPNSTRFADWGGRGIQVCDRWKDSFENFYADMGAMPGPRYSLERIDNDSNYSPENCRWATSTEQARNSRHNRVIEYNGEVHALIEWSEITGIKRTTISERLNRGWTVEEALTTPVLRKEHS